ncbi:MAG: EAL domain-containing protein [Marinobacterium sp.]|nr:EAL domain-containing protein [Marinobacterium sp.]
MKLFPWFQPVIEIASGRICGYEALARRYDAQGVAVSAAPLLFSSALDAGQRLKLDRQLRRQALERFAAEAAPDQYLSVNLSPEWMDALHPDDALPTLTMIEEVGIEPQRVVIEITELSGDVEQIRSLAQRYRDAGVRVAFDDFGAGFQQLDRLLAFTPDIIKLDMRMFHDSRWSHQKSTLMQLVGDMGARLGAQVICEGVETEDELMLALHCGAQLIQGYLFAPALGEFLAADARKARLQRLLDQHLDMAVNEVTRQQWGAQRLRTELLALREQLRSAEIERALQDYYPQADLLRLYLCDRRGEQVSANYSYSAGVGWQADTSVLGYNWSWRPYIYQLIASAEYDSTVLHSERYIDIATGQRCYTVSLALDAQRVLLVDMLEPDEDAGPMSLLSSCQSGSVAGALR